MIMGLHLQSLTAVFLSFMLQVRWWLPIMCDLWVLACHRGVTAAAAGTASQTVINLQSFSPTIDAYVSSHIQAFCKKWISPASFVLFFTTWGQIDQLFCRDFNRVCWNYRVRDNALRKEQHQVLTCFSRRMFDKQQCHEWHSLAFQQSKVLTQNLDFLSCFDCN